MTITNVDIAKSLADATTEQVKADVSKATIASDIRDWIEAHATAGFDCRNVSGCFIVGNNFLLNGRPCTLPNVATFLANENIRDLISMRSALAAHFQEALASLRQQKGTTP